MSGLGIPTIVVKKPDRYGDDSIVLADGPVFETRGVTFQASIVRYSRITGVGSGYGVGVIKFGSRDFIRLALFPTNRRSEAWSMFAGEIVRSLADCCREDIDNRVR